MAGKYAEIHCRGCNKINLDSKKKLECLLRRTKLKRKSLNWAGKEKGLNPKFGSVINHIPASSQMDEVNFSPWLLYKYTIVLIAVMARFTIWDYGMLTLYPGRLIWKYQEKTLITRLTCCSAGNEILILKGELTQQAKPRFFWLGNNGKVFTAFPTDSGVANCSSYNAVSRQQMETGLGPISALACRRK